jgi:hypothetical protein
MGEPECPFCGSGNTEKAADFGTSVMVRLHYCRACRSHFEAIKWGDDAKLDVPAFLEPRSRHDD